MDCRQINALAERLLGKEYKDQVEKFLEFGQVDKAQVCLLNLLVRSRVTNFDIRRACREADISDEEATDLIVALNSI